MFDLQFHRDVVFLGMVLVLGGGASHLVFLGMILVTAVNAWMLKRQSSMSLGAYL